MSLRGQRSPGHTLAAFALLALIAVTAYHNSLHGPFIFDDIRSIVENPDIHHLATTLRENPETGATLVGRPVLRLSLWVNYLLGGYETRGYHLLNLALHILVAWTLWGLVRRVLESPRLKDRYGKEAWGLSLAIALIWTVHPLQTESVTYVVQRAEILGGLFYLLTLYGVVRSIGAIGWSRFLWYSAAFVSCLLGMASKETAATAPLVAAALDRVFWTPSLQRMWQVRKGLYLVLASTWIPLAMMMSVSSQRMGSAGFGLGVDWWEYALTQPYYLCRYLALSVWPSALTLDYGFYLARTVREVAPYAAVVFLLAALTLAALWRKPALGFCGLWFFVILAPTSSLVPLVTQTGAEHRMYLPLAGLIGLAVVGGHALWSKLCPGRAELLRAGPVLMVALVAAVLAARTVVRNEDYRRDLSIWKTVVDRWPSNPRAHTNLGNALASTGHAAEAIAHYEEAIHLKPDYAEAHYNLGNALATAGKASEAIAEYEEALRLNADDAQAHNNLGNVLTRVGRIREAAAHYEEALHLNPDDAQAHNNLGNALTRVGRPMDAVVQYQEALRLNPDSAETHYNLGNSLATVGRATEAIAQFKEALRLKSDFSEVHKSLGNALVSAGRAPEAVAQYVEALRVRPDDAEAHNNLGRALGISGRAPEAVAHFQEALRLKPDYAEAHNNLGRALADAGSAGDAVAQYEEALRLKPDFADAYSNLAWLRATDPEARNRNGTEAVRLARQAVLLKDRDPNCLDTLAAAYAEVGQFSEAVSNAESALELALEGGNMALVKKIEAQLALYRARQSFHQGPYAAQPPPPDKY